MCTGLLLNSADVWATWRLAVESWDGWHDDAPATWTTQQVAGRAGRTVLDPVPRIDTRPVTLKATLRGVDAADGRTKLRLLKAVLACGSVRLTVPDQPTIELVAYRATLQVRNAPSWQKDLDVTITLSGFAAYARDIALTVVPNIGATPVALPLGSAPVRPLLTVVGASTNPVITARSGIDVAQGYVKTVAAASVSPENLLLYSEQLDNAAWVKTNCAVTPDAVTDPFGGARADLLTAVASLPSSAANQVIAGAVAGARYGMIAAVRGGTAGYAWMGESGDSGTGYHRAWVRLSDGVITGTDQVAAATSVPIVGPDGATWYLVTVWYVRTTGAGSLAPMIALSDASLSAAVTAGKTLYATRAQLFRARPIIGSLGLTLAIAATDQVTIDCDACSIVVNGLSNLAALTSGDFFELDPAFYADLAGASWPTLECSNGTIGASYRNRYR